MGRKRTESAQCKVAEKCASRVRVRGRETRNAMEQCGARIAGREEGVVTAEEGEGFAVQACRERQCQCACGRRVGWRCGSSRCVKSHRVPERTVLCCWTRVVWARVSNRTDRSFQQFALTFRFRPFDSTERCKISFVRSRSRSVASFIDQDIPGYAVFIRSIIDKRPAALFDDIVYIIHRNEKCNGEDRFEGQENRFCPPRLRLSSSA